MRQTWMFISILLIVIVCVGVALPFVAAAFAFRRPSIILGLLLPIGAVFWFCPPWTRITTVNISGTTIVTEHTVGHALDPSPSPYSSSSGGSAYTICWPQLEAEVALIALGMTLAYVLLRKVVPETRSSGMEHAGGEKPSS
jgi:hypothetical protein